MSESARIAMVTGAGSGIGRAAALHLLADGYAVVLTGRRLSALEETASLAGKDGERALAVAADVSDPQSVHSLFDRVRDTHGRLDVLFNNAGMGLPACEIDELGYEDWLSVVNVNLNGAFLCAQSAFRLMKTQRPQGGRIINNGSISAYVPRPKSIAYNATKHAVTGLTRSLSLDGRPYDIACGQIDIGNAGTEMTQRMSSGVLQANGTLAPEPTMDVAEVARSVVFMASLPLNANVQFMTVMASKMPFIGRG